MLLIRISGNCSDNTKKAIKYIGSDSSSHNQFSFNTKNLKNCCYWYAAVSLKLTKADVINTK